MKKRTGFILPAALAVILTACQKQPERAPEWAFLDCLTTPGKASGSLAAGATAP